MAAFVYVGPIARALARLKVDRRAEVARPLGDSLSAVVAPWLGDTEGIVVVPVPLHPSRQAVLGFNPAALIAARLARRLGTPFWPSALARTRPTAPQASLPRRERITQVAGAFLVREPEHVHGKSVLLVDDVWTTGATLDACTGVLLQVGSNRVSWSALARAGF